ncbi:MAG: hypothetical protein MUE69_25450 [Myxococcota bacterium]|nr:hypothetical protein [Myxococcota bacterium]
MPTAKIEVLESCLSFGLSSASKYRAFDCDWLAAEAVTGTLPSDYKTFVERRGQGVVDHFLSVFGAANLLFDAMQSLESMRVVRSDLPDLFPMPLFPEPEGWLPWGLTYNGDVCWWNRAHADPDRWTVCVTGRGPHVYEFDGGMVDFVSAVLLGKVRCTVFPRDFPSALPVEYSMIGDVVLGRR